MAYRRASAEVLEAVGKGQLTEGVLVDLSPEHETRWIGRVILAAWIRDTNVLGVWAFDEKSSGPGTIYALDGAAREFSKWAVAAKGDSRFEEERMKVLSFPEVAEAREGATTIRG